MSAQEEFVHPVIQAMQQAFQQIQGAKKQKFDQDLDTRQADLAAEQFKEAQKQHGIDSDFRQKNLDIALKQLEMTSKMHELEQSKALQEYALRGGKAQKQDLTIPGMQNDLGKVGQDINVPGGGNSVVPGTNIPYDPSNYQGPDEQLAQQLKGLQQSELIKNTVAQPFKDAENQRIIERQDDQEKNRFMRDLTVHNADRASQERVAMMKDQTDRYLGQLSSQTRLALAKVGENANDPAIDNYINDMYVAGNLDKIPGSAKVQNAIRGSVPKGWTPLNKEDKGQVENINVIDNLLGKTKELVTAGAGVTGKLSVLTGIGEAGKLNKEIEGMLGTLSRGVGKEKGVLTQKDIERAKGLVSSIRQGKDTNGEIYNDLKTLLDNGYRQVLQKYPEDQRAAILTSRGVDTQRFAQTPSGGGKKKTMIELDDGSRIADTPQNRQLHNLPLE